MAARAAGPPRPEPCPWTGQSPMPSSISSRRSRQQPL
jgi:hypothetical protein